MKQKIAKYWIYILAILISVLMFSVKGTESFGDTKSYISAWDNSLSFLQIDRSRTPIYPFFIGLCKSLFRQHYLFWFVIFQHIAFLVSIRYFERTASFFIVSRKVVQTVTFLYVVLFIQWSNCILTEAFAIIGVVSFIFTCFNFFRQPSWTGALYNSFWLLFLIMLRPSFLYLLVVSLCFWAFLCWKRFQYARIGFIGVIFICALELLYCCAMKQKYGLFSPSGVSVTNSMYIAVQDGLLKEEYFDSRNDRNYFRECNANKSDSAIWHLIGVLDLSSKQQVVKKSQKEFPLLWLKSSTKRFIRSSMAPMLDNYGDDYKIIQKYFGFRLTNLYLAVFIYFIAIIISCRRNKRIYIASTMLLLLVSAHIFTSTVAAQAEWGRLIAPSIPVALIMFGQMFNYIGIKTVVIDKNILK